VAEFALLLPVLLLIAVAVGDFGRVYWAATTLEAAAREAADYGAFDQGNWAPANRAGTEAQMQLRACTAASSLPGYVGAADHSSCSSPVFAYELERCEAADPSRAEPPCIVHVRLTYQFETVTRMPPFPAALTLVRESRFAISDLPRPPLP
jgi:hypothetical protein